MLIYTETNLGTRIAISVLPDSTSRDVKEKLERAHLNCFPELGAIRVKALKVNRKSCLYHLSESLPLAYVSEGLTGTLFLLAELHFSVTNNELVSSEYLCAKSSKRADDGHGDTNSTEPGNLDSSINGRKVKGIKRMRRMKKLVSWKFTFLEIWRVANGLKRKRRWNWPKDSRSISSLNHRFSQANHANRKKLDLFYSNGDDKWNKEILSRPVIDSPRGTLLESVSVSGLINKYFPIYDEVTSSYDKSLPTIAWHKDEYQEKISSESLNIHLHTSVVKGTPEMLPMPSPDEPSPGSSIMKHKKPNVGNRLLRASGTLDISGCKEPSALSFSKLRKASMQPKSGTCVGSSVYEISDTDTDD